MPKITYIQPDGDAVAHEVPEGTSVMRGAIDNDVEGIVAECGGNAMCATCHVYVVDDAGGLPDAQMEEDEMLDCTSAPRKHVSRLSCQLPVRAELDGLVVEVAPEQS